MEKMKCKVDPTHENVDKNGCWECFSEWCLIEMFKDIKEEKNESLL